MYKLYSSTVELTRKCNLNCIHCIVNAGAPKENELSTNEILKLIEDLHDLGCENISFTGGEPFLREEWPLFLQKASALNMQVIFMTNGFCLGDEEIEILSSFPQTALGISLDGSNSQIHDYIRGTNGAFDKFTNLIPKLKDAGIYVAIPTTVMKSNYNQLDEIRDLLIDLKVNNWQIQIAKPSLRMPKEEIINEEQYYALAEKIVNYRQEYSDKLTIIEADCIGYNSKLAKGLYIKNWKGCECGIYSLSIESNGLVKGCPNMNSYEGNLREKSIVEIWNDHNSFKYNRSPDLASLEGYCARCKYKYLCRGGCPSNPRTELSGTPYCLYKIEKEGFDKELSPEKVNQN